MLKEAINLLIDLSEELPDWYSDCDCYSTGKMKKFEYRIDDLLNRYHASQQANRELESQNLTNQSSRRKESWVCLNCGRGGSLGECCYWCKYLRC